MQDPGRASASGRAGLTHRRRSALPAMAATVSRQRVAALFTERLGLPCAWALSQPVGCRLGQRRSPYLPVLLGRLGVFRPVPTFPPRCSCQSCQDLFPIRSQLVPRSHVGRGVDPRLTIAHIAKSVDGIVLDSPRRMA